MHVPGQLGDHPPEALLLLRPGTEARRGLRIWFVGFNGLYILVLLLLRELFFPGAAWLHSLEYLPLGGLLLFHLTALWCAGGGWARLGDGASLLSWTTWRDTIGAVASRGAL